MQPSLLESRANYEPRAQVSPSRFKLSRICQRADAFRYVLGVREIEYTWDAIKNIPRPPADHDKKDKAAAKEHRARVSAWNRARRGPLGKEGHKIIEAWYASFTTTGDAFDPALWHTEPGRVMLAGLHLLPHPSTLHSWITEHKIPEGFVHDVSDGAFSFELNAYIDLLATWAQPTRHGYEIVSDHKTTSSFDWAMKPAELLEDPQGIVYPLYAMHAKRRGLSCNGTGVLTPIGSGNTEFIVPRWTYFRTEDAPSARAVDFRVTYDGAKRRALKLFTEGAVLVQRCVDRVDPKDVPANVSACLDFFHRTCIYHHSVGGPCNAESSPGKRLRASLATPNRREKIMGVGFKRAASAAKTAEGASTTEEPNTAGASEVASDNEGAEGAVTSDADASGAASGGGGGFKAKRGRPPKSATADGSGFVNVQTAHGSFAIPEGSPLNERLNSIGLALFGE